MNIYGRNGRIDPQYLEVWTKESSSEGWQKVPVASLSWNKTTEGWCVYFIGGTTAEEIKLHSTWDERDADYSPVDRSTFSALVKNIFEVSFTADGKESFWTYDAKGNRLSETESTGGIYSPSQSVTYYPNTDLIKTYGEWKFNYDRNGSLTSRGKTAAENQSEEEPFASWIFDASDGEVWYYEYDLSGRMTKSSSSKKGISGLTERATYAYDYRGLLVKKTYAEFTADEGVSITGGSTVKVAEWYEYTQDGRLLYTEKSSGSVTTKTDYIWAETTLWCEVDDGEVYYHHTDHLGTTEAVTDSTGNIVWHAEYEAFGSVLSENGIRSFTPSFTGKMLDECSGLYYFNARWYDSESGRFTTSDPIRDGVNFHNYCNGNPITFTDKNGLRGEDNSTDSYSEKKLEKLQKKYNSFIKKARKVGYNESADLLEHFLQGSGSTYFIDSDWLLQYSQVTNAITTNIERYDKQFKDIAKYMSPGEKMYLNELPSIGEDQIGPFGKSDYSGFASQQSADIIGRIRGIGNDLYYTTGTFTITSFCDVTITKDLEGSVSVDGTIQHIFWDKYDWHEGLTVYIPTVGTVKDADARYLEKYGPAQSFNMKSQWSSEYEKKF